MQVKQRQHLQGQVHYKAEKTTALIVSVNGVHGSVANSHTGKIRRPPAELRATTVTGFKKFEKFELQCFQ